MPVGRAFDITLNGKGYILARGQLKGRAWKRTGKANAVMPRASSADAARNQLPAELDFVAVYDDFSGGYGDAYKDPGIPNRIHWAENMDTRWPNQAVHCQHLILTTQTAAEYMMDMPPPIPNGSQAKNGGEGAVLVIGLEAARSYVPTDVQGGGALFASQFILNTEQTIVNDHFEGRPALFGSYSYLPVNDPEGFWQRGHSGQLYTQATPTLPGRAFTVAGNRMWRLSGNRYRNFLLSSVANGADPMIAANWSATLALGNGYWNGRDMTTLDDQVYVGMPDGLYAGDTSGTFFNVLGEVRNQPHLDNGRDLCAYNNGIVYPAVGGLYWYKPSQLSGAVAFEIGPTLQSNRSPISGYIRTVRNYGPWLYGGLWTGSQSYIVAGRDTGNGYAWHPQQRLPHTARIHRIHFDSITTSTGGVREIPTRCWVATDGSFGVLTNATAPLYVFPIPRNHGNPLAPDPVFSAYYMGSARMDFGRDNRGAPETLKVLRRLDVNTDVSTLTSGAVYADVYYALDGGSRSLLGRAQTSPRSTLFFPAAESRFVTCYDFELSIESFTASQAISPVYRSLVLHGAFLSEGADEITAVLDVADGKPNRQGTPMRSGAMQLAELRSLPGGPPVQLVDLTGAQNWVTVQRGIEEAEVYQEGSDEPEVAATVKLSVLQFLDNTNTAGSTSTDFVTWDQLIGLTWDQLAP